MKEIWAKIMFFLEGCNFLEEIKTKNENDYRRKQEAIDKLYKKDSKVYTMEVSDDFVKDTSIINSIVKAKENIKKAKVKKVVKPKRHWYNDTHSQKLVIEGEEAKLPKTWKKGRLPKVKKD